MAPETLRRQFRLRAALLTAVALVGGACLGVLLSRLVLALVRLVGAAARRPGRRCASMPSWSLELRRRSSPSRSLAALSSS